MLKAFKLVTGEEIIGSVVSTDDDTITLEQARTIMITPTADGRMNLSLVPWMVSAQDPTTGTEKLAILHTRSVVGTPSDVPLALEKGYLQNTSTIQLM